MAQSGSASQTLEPRSLYGVQIGAGAAAGRRPGPTCLASPPPLSIALCSSENRASSYHDVPNLLLLREATMRTSIIETGKAVSSPSLLHHARRLRALEPPPSHLSLNCGTAHRLTS